MFKLPDFPSVDFSKFDLPKLDLPAVDLPTIDVDKLTSAVRDLGYLTVGLGAAAVQQAQARRRELATTIVDGYEATKIQVDTAVDKIEAMLPEKVAALLGQARDLTESASNQVLGLIRNVA